MLLKVIGDPDTFQECVLEGVEVSWIVEPNLPLDSGEQYDSLARGFGISNRDGDGGGGHRPNHSGGEGVQGETAAAPPPPPPPPLRNITLHEYQSGVRGGPVGPPLDWQLSPKALNLAGFLHLYATLRSSSGGTPQVVASPTPADAASPASPASGSVALLGSDTETESDDDLYGRNHSAPLPTAATPAEEGGSGMGGDAGGAQHVRQQQAQQSKPSTLQGEKGNPLSPAPVCTPRRGSGGPPYPEGFCQSTGLRLVSPPMKLAPHFTDHDYVFICGAEKVVNRVYRKRRVVVLKPHRLLLCKADHPATIKLCLKLQEITSVIRGGPGHRSSLLPGGDETCDVLLCHKRGKPDQHIRFLKGYVDEVEYTAESMLLHFRDALHRAFAARGIPCPWVESAGSDRLASLGVFTRRSSLPSSDPGTSPRGIAPPPLLPRTPSAPDDSSGTQQSRGVETAALSPPSPLPSPRTPVDGGGGDGAAANAKSPAEASSSSPLAMSPLSPHPSGGAEGEEEDILLRQRQRQQQQHRGWQGGGDGGCDAIPPRREARSLPQGVGGGGGGGVSEVRCVETQTHGPFSVSRGAQCGGGGGGGGGGGAPPSQQHEEGALLRAERGAREVAEAEVGRARAEIGSLRGVVEGLQACLEETTVQLRAELQGGGARRQGVDPAEHDRVCRENRALQDALATARAAGRRAGNQADQRDTAVTLYEAALSRKDRIIASLQDEVRMLRAELEDVPPPPCMEGGTSDSSTVHPALLEDTMGQRDWVFDL